MKRLLLAFAAGIFLLGILGVLVAPFFTLPQPPLPVPPPQTAPERVEPPLIAFVASATGRESLIPMEEYVAGVVAAEMDPTFPDQALAAQAIMARTFAHKRTRVGEKASDDIRRFQAYNPTGITENIRRAVESTRGLVMLYQGEPVEALYHACSGGRTAGAEEGMQIPDRPYLRLTADPPCRRDETWTVRFGQREVAAAAGIRGDVRRVAIGRRGESGRALTLSINGQEVSAFHLRAGLSGTRLKSTYLTDVRVTDGAVVISGRGFGHGVGLSQWGAATLAEKGFTAAEIIDHYFQAIRLEKLW